MRVHESSPGEMLRFLALAQSRLVCGGDLASIAWVERELVLRAPLCSRRYSDWEGARSVSISPYQARPARCESREKHARVRTKLGVAPR